MNLAIHPPVHVTTHPDEPIRSVDAAVKFIERHAGGDFDVEAGNLIRQLAGANTEREADQAGRAFRDWADSAGLLLKPDDD